MSRQFQRELLSALAPELQTAQSQQTAETGILISRPIRLFGIIANGVGASVNVHLYDGDANISEPLIFLGELAASNRVVMYCPGHLVFNTDVRANLSTTGQEFDYTLFYQGI